jgi:hypothetical protein
VVKYQQGGREGEVMENYYVQIIRYDDCIVETELGPYTERRAELADGGINRNLNHEDYYTKIVQKNSDFVAA